MRAPRTVPSRTSVICVSLFACGTVHQCQMFQFASSTSLQSAAGHSHLESPVLSSSIPPPLQRAALSTPQKPITWPSCKNHPPPNSPNIPWTTRHPLPLNHPPSTPSSPQHPVPPPPPPPILPAPSARCPSGPPLAAQQVQIGGDLDKALQDEGGGGPPLGDRVPAVLHQVHQSRPVAEDLRRPREAVASSQVVVHRLEERKKDILERDARLGHQRVGRDGAQTVGN
jgi:hypothetical protein